ncbi:MAG TPA: hypothetical protein VNA32_04625 [Actinomycetota bacterium]|nr:hypothetical protein [Actinomycetota bacterium]
MTLSLAKAAGHGRRRYDPVEAAYQGMSPADRKAFRQLIQDPVNYTHAHVAMALREVGYDVDRKQVHHYREKLALGRVSL